MSINQYRSGLRSVTRGLWSGAFTRTQFNSEIRTIINNRLSQAWDEGAAECDITPEEYTQDEFIALGQAIQNELSNIPGLADRIQDNSQANGGKLTPLFSRIDNLWVNRYNDIKNQAKTLACKDKKLEWRLGRTEEHCSTCPRLNGKVKRASEWARVGVRPQNPPNPAIECGGWNCRCQLVVTDKPISKGPLPRIR